MVSTGGAPIGAAALIASMGFMCGKLTGLIAKCEGGGLLQPAKPGSGANFCRRLAFLLLIGQDHVLHDTGRERGLLHTHLLL